MSGKVISVVNMKGGVGKTTVVVGLSETLATDKNSSVLVVDVDTQASASYCLAGDDALKNLIRTDRTIDELFNARLVGAVPRLMKDFVASGVCGLTHAGHKLDVSLLASSPYLRQTEREIIYTLTQRGHSMNAIEGRAIATLKPDMDAFRERYDYIIFDCAPGISAFTTAAIALSDLIIVPTIPDFLSTLGLAAFSRTVLKGLPAQSSRRKAYALITRKNNTKQHREHHDIIKQKAQEPDSLFSIFETVIQESTRFPDAINKIDSECTTYAQKYQSPVNEILFNLATEVKKALHDHNN